MNLDRIIAVRNDRTVYRDGDYTLKVFGRNYSGSDVLKEAMNQSRAYEIGLRVPQVREVTKIDEKWAIVSEYIRGQTLGKLIKTNPNRAEEYMRLLFDTQREIHSKIGSDGRLCMCHGDFEPSNVVVSDDGNPYTIDWAKAEYGDPLHDCAVTYLLLLLSGESGCAEIYLNLFENKEQLREYIPSAARAMLGDANEREREFLRRFL